MPLKKYYQWERFWCPASGSYSLDNSGFLVDPKSEWGKYYKDNNALTFDEIPTTSCLVLLGEPGIGKTKALEDAFNSYPSDGHSQAVWLDLRSYATDMRLISSIESNPLINDWINGDHKLTLFLDSLDEGQLNVKTIAAVLVDLIKRWPRTRLEIRFACRTADWPKLLDTEMRLLFGLEEIPKYELLPLRRIDVESAASLEGIDSRQFIKAVQDAEVTAFANRPVTLKFLLNSYKLDGSLSEHKSEVYRRGCIQLCEERNESRLASKQTGKLAPAQRIMVAARISAAMMFSKKYAVWTDAEGNVTDEDLSILSLSGFSEKIYGIEFPVDEDAVKETLATGLFNSRGESRIGFAHQTYPEYLAAYYLIQKHVPLENILSLIIHSDGKIIPQLQEVAIWLATLSEDIFAELFDVQRDTMLYVPKDALINKKRILERLLADYESGDLIEYHHLAKYFNRLQYSGMVDQLRPYLINRKRKMEARCVAILLAEECKVIELLSNLVSISLDQKETQLIREYAANAVLSVGDKDSQLALMPLALGMAGEDPQDELKAIGFKAVWGKAQTIEDLLESIKPPKKENLIGAYYSFLAHEFSEIIQVKHLGRVLEWLLERKPNLGNETLEDEMIRGVMFRAWDHLENSQITELFAKLAYRRLLGYQESRGSHYDKVYTNHLIENPIKRHLLVHRLVDLMESVQDAFYLTYKPSFLFHDDIDWIVENIHHASKIQNREIWAQLLCNLVDIHDQDDLSKAYDVYEQYPETSTIFLKLFGPIDLNSEIVKLMRDFESRGSAVEQARTENSRSQVNYHSQLMLYVDQFDNGDIDAWWKLNLLILSSDPNKSGGEFDVDLASFALWESLDAQARENLILMAMKYLEQHSSGEIYLEDGRIYRPSISGFRALYLIATQKAELLNSITRETWNKWAPVILSYPVFGNKETKATHQILASCLLQYSRQSFYEFLQIQFDKEGRVDQYLRILDLLEHLDTEELQNFLVKILETRNLSAIGFGQLIHFLLVRNNLRAKQISFETLQSKANNDSISLQKKLRAAKSLMLYSDDGGWQVIKNEISKDRNFGECLFLELAYERRGLANILVNKFSEGEVVELYVWLETIFPEAEDPHVTGMHEVSDRESVGQIRDSLIPALTEKGNDQACLGIRSLMNKYPEKNNLLYYLRRCEDKRRSNNWIPNQPHTILEITRNAYKEYIQHKRTMLNYVIGITSTITMLLVNFLLNTLNYDRLDFFKSNQILPIGLILVLTVIIMVTNLNRPIPE